MDGFSGAEPVRWRSTRHPVGAAARGRRWTGHSAHGALATPHQQTARLRVFRSEDPLTMAATPRHKHDDLDTVVLDGSRGEGGGQILRTALTLSLLTGRPFRMVKIRANRDKPGLRPQHQAAVAAAARLGNAQVIGNVVGAKELTFAPARSYTVSDLVLDIGTAGSTGLVLQTLHLPLAMRAHGPTRVSLTGGTFNPKAPAFFFLDATWRAHLAAIGMPLTLGMPSAGFYPRGGGELEAWIEPATPQPLRQTGRGPLQVVRGVAGVSNLDEDIARRMCDRAVERLGERGIRAEIYLMAWPSPGQGAAIALATHHDGATPATFVGIGERGLPSEAVADRAIDELLAFEAVTGAAVDPYSADQILVPLALASGPSEFTTSEVTEHLRTNALTIRAFLDRAITIVEPESAGQPARVTIV